MQQWNNRYWKPSVLIIKWPRIIQASLILKPAVCSLNITYHWGRRRKLTEPRFPVREGLKKEGRKRRTELDNDREEEGTQRQTRDRDRWRHRKKQVWQNENKTAWQRRQQENPNSISTDQLLPENSSEISVCPAGFRSCFSSRRKVDYKGEAKQNPCSVKKSRCETMFTEAGSPAPNSPYFIWDGWCITRRDRAKLGIFNSTKILKKADLLSHKRGRTE